jgi:hypothetical protein
MIMQSINHEINLLHQCYCVSMGIGEMPLVPLFERWWFDAVQAGITCEDIRLVISDRQRRVKDGVRHRECLLLRNVCSSEETIGNLIMEAAALKAARRIRTVDGGKAEVLRATGRGKEMSSNDAVPIGKVIEALRKAAG